MRPGLEQYTGSNREYLANLLSKYEQLKHNLQLRSNANILDHSMIEWEGQQENGYEVMRQLEEYFTEMGIQYIKDC